MGITYVDIKLVPVNDEQHVSELTWVNEVGFKLSTRHYFVDYPGAKDLERQIIEVVGGTPMVRYALPVVIRAFLSDVPEHNIIAAQTNEQKDYLSELVQANKLNCPRLITFSEVLEVDGELDAIKSEIKKARVVAPRKFGNSL